MAEERIRKGYQIEVEIREGKPELNSYNDYGRFKSNKPTSDEDILMVNHAKYMLGQLERLSGTNKIRLKLEVF